MADDVEDCDPVQAHGIGTARRPRGKHARKRRRGQPAWVYLKHIAFRAMQPGKDKQIVAGHDSKQARSKWLLKLQPGLGATLVALTWRRLQADQLRTYDSYRL